MNATVEDLRATIIPKSDQLNADQLVTGPMDVTVTEVRLGSGADQPVIVHYENDHGRPFKPCKTMRRVLILAWGENGRNWVGRSMRLYHAPEVKFGGSAVGGIRISHMTDIPKDISVSLSETKGKKVMHVIKRMADPTPVDTSGIDTADTLDELKTIFGVAYKAAKGQEAVRGRLKVAYDLRVAALTMTAAIERIDNAADREAASAVLEEARGQLGEEHHAELQQAFDRAWEGA